MTTPLAVLQWVTDTLAQECDIVVSSPDENISERFDSMSLVTMIVAIEEKYGLDLGMKEFDRERWSTPIKISEDVFELLARPDRQGSEGAP